MKLRKKILQETLMLPSVVFIKDWEICISWKQLKMMIATFFVGLVLAIGIHVEAGPTPNLQMDLGCTINDAEM